VVAVSEEPQPGAGPDTPVSPAAGQDVDLAKARRLSDMVAGRLADQARRTAEAARARRVTSAHGQPGMTDLTPLRELLSELMAEVRKVRPRERTAHALRQAADRIDPPGR
jgi:hypothetical protein